jgi:hypothetical protein
MEFYRQTSVQAGFRPMCFLLFVHTIFPVPALRMQFMPCFIQLKRVLLGNVAHEHCRGLLGVSDLPTCSLLLHYYPNPEYFQLVTRDPG